MTSISNLGVGSGLDLSSLLDQLTTAEQAPLDAIKSRASSYQSKLSAYGTLQSMLGAFQGSAKQLADPNFFNSTTAASSNTTVLSAAGSNTATSGTYAINVSALAQSQSLVSAGQASQTAVLTTGTIHIDFGTITDTATGTLDTDPSHATYGKYSGATFNANAGSTGFDIKIDSTNNTLQGVRDAINKANAGVTASIINDGSGVPYRLVLTSNTTGATNSMQIKVSDEAGTGASLSGLLSYDVSAGVTGQNLQQTTAAQNAQLTVNNIAVQSTSNTVSGAIQGVTLNLAQTGSSTVSVQRDTGTIQSGVQAFVTAYNNLQKAATSLSAYDPSTNTGSPLTGDTTLRIIQSQMRGLMNMPQVGSGANAITTLSQVGVTFQTDGTIQLDSSKLKDALNANPTGVAALFGSTDGKSGYGNQINNLVSTLTSSNGALTSATNGITQTLRDLGTQYAAQQDLVNATIANYKAQFTQLDMIMAQMKNTSTYLTQQFSAMTNSSSSK
ncbi:Flagellar hook-associated protein 2 [Cupriavidus yeoncheonensis]|uniref:Flagellar hook-associated protein 2 n=1 Tax=Cupriavidus yeoncheonensis TaxID=1462994 RepID=A0A916IZX0_9BURK|nr:flagellar filament capping protein FliD [Cupriavidus yeoncheonensis]CAG2154527.1 Flagellar hook-associated protein 2 [Cupriavidus yeoncheonensis]